jgi:hypothetical protein
MSRIELLEFLPTLQYQTDRWLAAMQWCQVEGIAPANASDIFTVVRSGEYINPFTLTIYIVSCINDTKVSAVQVQETDKLYKLSETSIFKSQFKKSDAMKVLEGNVYDSYYMFSSNSDDIPLMVHLVQERTIAQHKKLQEKSKKIIETIENMPEIYINKNKYN